MIEHISGGGLQGESENYLRNANEKHQKIIKSIPFAIERIECLKSLIINEEEKLKSSNWESSEEDIQKSLKFFENVFSGSIIIILDLRLDPEIYYKDLSNCLEDHIVSFYNNSLEAFQTGEKSLRFLKLNLKTQNKSVWIMVNDLGRIIRNNYSDIHSFEIKNKINKNIKEPKVRKIWKEDYEFKQKLKKLLNNPKRRDVSGNIEFENILQEYEKSKNYLQNNEKDFQNDLNIVLNCGISLIKLKNELQEIKTRMQNIEEDLQRILRDSNIGCKLIEKESQELNESHEFLDEIEGKKPSNLIEL